jgi:hypothetical protein
LVVISWCQFPSISHPVSCLLIGVALVRVADITQAVVNIGLFDWLGDPQASSKAVQQVHDLVRSVVFFVWNFLELIVWFGLAYLPLQFTKDSSCFWSRFYFSAVTQLTIGYGDLTPLGGATVLAVAQGLLGWILTVLVIGRFVGALPDLRAAHRAE